MYYKAHAKSAKHYMQPRKHMQVRPKSTCKAIQNAHARSVKKAHAKSVKKHMKGLEYYI